MQSIESNQTFEISGYRFDHTVSNTRINICNNRIESLEWAKQLNWRKERTLPSGNRMSICCFLASKSTSRTETLAQYNVSKSSGDKQINEPYNNLGINSNESTKWNIPRAAGPIYILINLKANTTHNT
jgi:hypothetical protein